MDISASLIAIIQETWFILTEGAPWILFGFAASALVKAVIPDDFVIRHLGKSSAGSVFKAALLGIPLPLCSCGVLPAAAGIRKQGASKGATAAFLITTPETGVDSIAITYALLDPVMTIIRPVSSFFSGALAGMAINTLPGVFPA